LEFTGGCEMGIPMSFREKAFIGLRNTGFEW